MYCKICGKQIDKDSVFCSYCGSKQSSNSENISTSKIQMDNQSVIESKPTANQPIHKEHTIEVDKYDSSYEKEVEATRVGLYLIIINFVLLYTGVLKDAVVYSVILALSLILRVFILIWCYNIAKRQNRNLFGWVLFSFFLPSIALIIIGQLQKIKFYNEESQEINSDLSETATRIVIKETREGKKLQIHSSLSVGYTIGDKVTIDGNPAPNGKYYMGFMDYIIIENGKLKSF